MPIVINEKDNKGKVSVDQQEKEMFKQLKGIGIDLEKNLVVQDMSSDLNGSIVLFHNAGEHTPEALPDILDYLLGEGYEIVPISKILLTNEETYIDHTGRQCRSAET